MEGFDRTLDALAAAMGDGLLGVQTDRGETTLIVDKGSIRQTCRALRDGHERFVHLSGVTGVDYLGMGLEPRFAVVYHLYSPSARLRLRLKVPVQESDPVVPSVVSVWPTANWHEREVFDLFGIRFEGHPNLARILMPDDATDHPLRKDSPLGGEDVQFSHNVTPPPRIEEVSLAHRFNGSAVSALKPEPDSEVMLLNMGPQHPATHGVLRLVLALDGEVVTDVTPVIGYLHTGFEKTYEHKKYQQCVTLTDRMDYLNPLGNNLAFALAVEKLLGIEAPPRAQVARVLLAELTRIQSHLVAVGSCALDLGASSMMMYAFRERETLLDIFEMCSGQRMMTSFIRPGGLAKDLPPGFEEAVRAFIESFPARMEEYHGLLTRNEIWLQRMVCVGRFTGEQCVQYGLTGPLLRASGIARDLRKDQPYSGYESYDFDVITRDEGDCYARYLVRMDEMRESLKIVKQALDRMPEGRHVVDDYKIAFPPRPEISTNMEALIHHFKLATEGYRVPAGEVYSCVESPRGELGFYIISDGSSKPYRVHVRTPSFTNLQSLPVMARGGMVADLVPMIASIDPIMGDVDR